MAAIQEAGKTVGDFLKKTLNAKEVTVIKVVRVSDGWETEAEVYEDSAFMKSIGLPVKVKDRNVYTVKLSADLEVQSYGRKGEGESSE
ncbi:MAG: hypothetical protein WCP22_04510 [Chlamydiota bacterium]